MGKEVVKALLSAPEGKKISILDFKAQGLCIMAALSGDPVMQRLARAKDPYLGFGMLMRLIPHDDYVTLDVSALRARYGAERDGLKKLFLAYQYGAGAQRLEDVYPTQYGGDIKRTLDKLFSQYVYWKKSLSPVLVLPDGFEATGENPAVTHVQGTDAYILRRIVSEIDLPEGARIIATNHDCVWVEHTAGFDISPIARQMEAIADQTCKVVTPLFRVDVETIPHT
jgi:hypothetical protein